MKDTKIIFVDLDGTLKNQEKKVSVRSQRVIKRLMDTGIQIVLTTGRPLPYTISLAKQLSTSSYVISSNGAEIYNYVNKKLLYQEPIDQKNLPILQDLISKYQLFFIANCLLDSYTNKTFDEPGKKVISSILEIPEEVSQLIVESFDINKMKLFRKEIKDLPDIQISNKSRNIKDKNSLLFYDVTKKGVSKGKAVSFLCHYLGIKKEKTMAVGDSDNDISMLQESDVKVAMANATQNLKEEANYITLSNEQDGVAVILEKLYKELNKM